MRRLPHSDKVAPFAVIIKSIKYLLDGYGISDNDGRVRAQGLMEELDRAGYVIAPKEPTDDMCMRGGNVPISNVGENARDRKGCIGDKVAAEVWRVMASNRRQER